MLKKEGGKEEQINRLMQLKLKAKRLNIRDRPEKDEIKEVNKDKQTLKEHKESIEKEESLQNNGLDEVYNYSFKVVLHRNSSRNRD